MPFIYQISSKPIEVEALLTDDDVADSWLFAQIVDHVQDHNHERFELYDQLVTLLVGRFGERSGFVQLERDETGNLVAFMVADGYPAAYFAKPYELFRTKLNQMAAELTFEAFLLPGAASDVAALKAYVDDKYGDYVCEDHDYNTIARFIRYIVPGVKYYVGSVLFYN